MRRATSGLANARWISAFSRPTIGRGMPAGATNACQPVGPRFTPCSRAVGTSAANGERSNPDAANARNQPFRTKPSPAPRMPA